MRERVLAVLGAVALVVVALVIRSVAFGDDDPSTPGRQRGGPKAVVACTEPLQTICDALAADDAIVPHAPIDLTSAADAAPDVDAWIAPEAGPAVLAVDPGTPADAYQARPAVFARAELSVLAPGEVAQELCGTEAIGSWDCMANGGDDIAVGVGRSNTAEGLARLAGLANGLPVADQDATALRRIIDSPTSGQSDAKEQATAIVTQLGSYGAVIGPEGLLRRLAGSTRAGGRFEVSTPAPTQQIELVVASSARRTGSVDLAGALARPDVRAALTDLGYQPATGGSPMGEFLAGKLWQAWKVLNR